MNNYSYYKILVSFLHFLRNTLVVLPFVYSGVSLNKGGFDYGLETYFLNLNSALLISAGIAILMTVWNIMEFGKYPNISPDQYLKPKQKYKLELKEDISINQIKEALNKRLLQRKRWKMLSKDETSILLAYRFYAIYRDIVLIEKSEDGITIQSAPSSIIFYMDLARNYKHIVSITKEIVNNGAE